MANQPQNPLTTSSKLSLIKEEQSAEEAVSLQADSLVTIMALPMVLKAALELGVIETLTAVDGDVWLSSYEIALRLPTKPTNPEAPVLLDRMLIFLASHSILKYRMVETGENGKTKRVYAAAPICKFYSTRGDGSGSLAPLFLLNLSEIYFKTWKHFKDVILEGKDAFTSAHGMSFFKYICWNGQFGEMFIESISDACTLTMKKVLEVYRGFEDVNTLVDVGGGLGTAISLVISKYPHIKGINLDITCVITHAPLYPGVENVSGDMFTEIPKGDAMFLKWILHCWNDEDCVKILKNCWRSLPETGKVIIVDVMKPTQPKIEDLYSNNAFAKDMVMLTFLSGGQERYFCEIEALAFASGFRRCEIICLAYSYSVIELHK
ncbi:unnamed protein product [Eruca vesicaria subsp. sativa]|uniref:Caffeic acid O-methyltransferase n=1 Tax=Eruca vesicaria subsp. sativa TaxID=29727 RepID=A0ABC8KPS3_ERUVS|nr:unnamed protein product [Eruca vesicaria subsp. sativa]